MALPSNEETLGKNGGGLRSFAGPRASYTSPSPTPSYPLSAFTMVLPSAAGLSATWMPALLIASIL